MLAMKEEVLGLARQMSADELADLPLPLKRLGRKRSGNEKYKSIGITVPPELEQLLLTLVEQRRTTMSALVRELIKLGLPALTGRHVHELLEAPDSAVSRNGH